MSRTLKAMFAMAAVGGTLALAPALRAQEPPASAAPKAPGVTDHHGMMGGDMSGMMRMMEHCSRMMQSMNDPSGAKPRGTPPATPENKG